MVPCLGWCPIICGMMPKSWILSHLFEKNRNWYLGGGFKHFSPNSVVTLGVLTVVVKSRVARSRWRTGGAQISSLFSWFRAYMFVSPVNSRSFGLAAATRTAFVCKFSEFPALQLLRCSFFVVILVLFGDLRCSWKGLKRVSSVNFRTFLALQLLRCSFFVVILVLFGVLQCSWTVFLQENSCFFDVFGAATSSPRTDIDFSW